MEIQSLQEAEKRLKEIIYKQSMVKHGLREATARLKATMTTFVSRLSDTLAANDEYQEKITAHVERIHGTEDVLELNRILESLINETRIAQADNRRAHDQLVQERDAAVQAEARIMQLETQLTEMSNAGARRPAHRQPQPARHGRRIRPRSLACRPPECPVLHRRTSTSTISRH